MHQLILLSSIVLISLAGTIKRGDGEQSYSVKGKFMCGSRPARDVEVKLVDDDFGPDQDDVLDSKMTDENGTFEVKGNTKELTTIDVHLKIYHECDDGLTPCQRRWNFELPNQYIGKGPEAKEVLNIGVWNLEALMPGESRDCQH